MWFHRVVLITVSLLTVVAATPEAQGNGAIPITSCGQTVTTSAVLTQDLICTGAGIIVGAPGITIDLKGFRITGDHGAGDYGVDDAAGHGEITVKNGVLLDFDDGVYAKNADKVAISNILAAGNSTWGIYVDGASTKITSSRAFANGYSGIYVAGGSAQITSSIASSNPNFGIFVMGANAKIKSTSASGNGVGITVQGDGATIQSSTASANPNTGIIVSGLSARIKSSAASGSVFYGIQIVGASASIQSSTAFANGTGIIIQGDAASLKGNRADGNGFSPGSSNPNGLGIHVLNFTTPPVGTKNTAKGNGDPAGCDPASLC